MRTWIYNRIANLVLPNGMAQRVLSSGGADNPAKPFIILTMGQEQTPLGMPATSRTQEVPFDVWVHDRPGTMVDNIDAACLVLKQELPIDQSMMIGNLSLISLWWEETSADAFDDQFKTNTRRVSFRAMTRR